MNPKNPLHAWSNEWAALRSMADTSLPEETKPERAAAGSAEPASSPLTVSAGSGVADMLLRQLSASVAPDLASQAEGNPHTVLAGSRPKNAAAMLAAGQILHLKSTGDAMLDRSLHVLVLKVDSAASRVLVAPFGPIPIPATEAELLTGLEDDPLKVLCLWNARWLPADVAVKSWSVGQADAALVADAVALREAVARREALPAHLSSRTGPPLLMPDDAIQAYLDEEEQIWSMLKSDD